MGTAGRRRGAPKRSAGLLLWRRRDGRIEVLLAHMGGPLWSNRSAGAWTIPKGEYEDGEAPLAAARREFAEELGAPPPAGEPLPVGEVRQRNGKLVTAFALEGDFDAAAARSNTFRMEWPRGSGRHADFPEIDRAEWIELERARRLVIAAQAELLDRLAQRAGFG